MKGVEFMPEIITLSMLLEELQNYIENKNDIKLITMAYEFAKKAHTGQFRKSGEEYIHHPLAVALILAQLHSSPDVICAGLLHDVIEDTPATYDELKELFNIQIANIVQGVTKLEKIKYKEGEQSAANYQNLILSMIDDVNVIFVKLADRQHNMRTLGAMPQVKQERIAKETLDILVPIAHRLGIYLTKSELEDLSLRVLEPKKYYYIVDCLNLKREERVLKLENMTSKISNLLGKHQLNFDVKSRIKNIFSIYKKMYIKGKEFDEIYDLSALRILTATVPDCYAVLGYIHSEFTPIPSRVKDYIAMPKPNGYQSLHTTILGNDGIIYEIQIRTKEMEIIAEYGVASHWIYKENLEDKNMKISKQNEQIKLFEEIKNMIENSTTEDSNTFMDSLKSDVLNANIYVFTPSGDVFALPKGSTPIDFAYRIHSKVGDKTIGAKVNDKIVTLGYTLKTGDVVEILTLPSAKPKEAWLRIAKMNSTKSKIRQFLKRERRDEYLALGHEKLLIALEAKDKTIADLIASSKYDEQLDKLSIGELDDLYVTIGNGGVSATTFCNKIFSDVDEINLDDLLRQAKVVRKKSSKSQSIISLGEVENISYQLANCCHPIIGEEIVGYVSPSKGLVVHKSNCPTIKTLDVHRLVEITWTNTQLDNVTFEVGLTILSFDRDNLLQDIVQTLYKIKTNIIEFSSTVNEDSATVTKLRITASNRENLQQTIVSLERIPGVFSVMRSDS